MTNAKEHKAILIADDQAFIRSLLVSMLRDLGYRPVEAVDGNQAMQQLSLRPAAAILDHRMAGLTGLEILQAIRCGHTSQKRGLPVLMLTGHADEHIVRAAGELDVSALLTKPVSKVQLRDRLETALKRSSRLRAPADYVDVDVRPAECTAAPRSSSSGAWILRETIIPRAAAFVPGAEMKKKTGSLLGDEIHVSRIEPGMIVSQDIYSAGGRLLLAAGTELTEKAIKRLTKLCEDNPDLRYLNVKPAKKAEIYATVAEQAVKNA